MRKLLSRAIFFAAFVWFVIGLSVFPPVFGWQARASLAAAADISSTPEADTTAVMNAAEDSTVTNSILPCTTTTIPPCIDEDGDAYGDGDGCLGPDSDDTDPDVHACTIQVLPNRVSKSLTIMKPVTVFYIRAGQGVAFSKHAEIVWGSDAIQTAWVFPLDLRPRSLLVVAFIDPKLLSVEDDYVIEVDGWCNGRLKVTMF